MTRLLRKPAQAASCLLGETLRVQAIALTELGGLAQSLGRVLQDALESGRPASAPDPAARGPLADEEQPTSEPGRPAEPRPVAVSDRQPHRALDIPTRRPHIAPALPPDSAPRVPKPAATPTEHRPAPTAGHVSEQPVLVSESADPGAVDGAGASVHVQEPWSGYRAMRAREIVDRLPALPDEVLSLVLLYEAKPGKSRRSVLQAAERELSRRAA